MLEERISSVTISGEGTLGLRCTPDPLPAGFGITHRWEPYAADALPTDPGGSGVLASLPDLVGSADMVPNAMGSTGATGPSFHVIGGQVGMGFGAPRRLMTPLARSQPHTIVALVRPRTEGYTALSVLLGAATTAGARGSVYLTADGLWAMNAGSTISNSAPLKGGQWQIVIAVFNGPNSVLRVDGVETTGNAGSEVADRLILGSFANLGGPLVAYLGSVYYASSAWTLTQRNDFEAWLRKVNRLPAA